MTWTYEKKLFRNVNPLLLPVKTVLFADYDFNVKMYDVMFIIYECNCSYLMTIYILLVYFMQYSWYSGTLVTSVVHIVQWRWILIGLILIFLENIFICKKTIQGHKVSYQRRPDRDILRFFRSNFLDDFSIMLRMQWRSLLYTGPMHFWTRV